MGDCESNKPVTSAVFAPKPLRYIRKGNRPIVDYFDGIARLLEQQELYARNQLLHTPESQLEAAAARLREEEKWLRAALTNHAAGKTNGLSKSNKRRRLDPNAEEFKLPAAKK